MSKNERFEIISEFENGDKVVKFNEKCGVINENGDVIIKIKYDKIIKHDQLYIVEKKQSFRLKNTKGENITKIKYDEIKDTNSYLFRVRIGDWYGLIDFSGNEVLKVRYKEIRPIYYECADYFIVTNKESKCGLIDKLGNVLLKCKYYAIYRLHHDKFTVLNDDGYAIYSIYKGMVLDFKLSTRPILLSHSLNVISTINNKYGIIDLNGNNVTEFKYDAMYLCSRYADEISAKIGEKYCLINSYGMKVTDVKYDYIKYIDVDLKLLIVREGAKFGIINNGGNIILDTSFDAIKMLSSQFILTRKMNEYSIFSIFGSKIHENFRKEDFKKVCQMNNIICDLQVIDILS